MFYPGDKQPLWPEPLVESSGSLLSGRTLVSCNSRGLYVDSGCARSCWEGVLWVQETSRPIIPSHHSWKPCLSFFSYWSIVDLKYCISLGVKQRDSGIHIFVCLYILFWIPCHYTLFSSVVSDSLPSHGLPGFPVHHQLPEFTQTHVHQVGDAVQPSHPLSSPSPPSFSLSQHQGLFKRVSSSHQLANVLEFQLQHQLFQWIFTADFL